jgi:hypothetical protein
MMQWLRNIFDKAFKTTASKEEFCDCSMCLENLNRDPNDSNAPPKAPRIRVRYHY